MLFVIVALTFISSVLGVAGLYWLFSRRPSIADRLEPVEKAKQEATRTEAPEPTENLAERVAMPLNRLVPPSVTEAQKLQKQLLMAGYFSHNAPSVYHGIQMASMFGFPALTALICLLLAQPMGRLM